MLIVASGNVVHNLRGMDRRLTDEGFDWAQRFDDEAREPMLADPGDVGALDGHRDFDLAVPTPDHFIPLLYLAGLADAGGRAGRARRRLRLRLAVDDGLHPGPQLRRRGRGTSKRSRPADRRAA